MLDGPGRLVVVVSCSVSRSINFDKVDPDRDRDANHLPYDKEHRVEETENNTMLSLIHANLTYLTLLTSYLVVNLS